MSESESETNSKIIQYTSKTINKQFDPPSVGRAARPKAWIRSPVRDGQVQNPPLPSSPKENCGLFAIFGDPEAVKKVYFGLHSLQHRGQESAGIATSDSKLIQCYKGMGTVRRVLRSGSGILERLSNPIAIGHVRYSTSGANKPINSQPLLAEYSHGQVAVAHNGNLINAILLRDEYEAHGSIFKSTSDTEIIVHLLAKPTHNSKPDPLAHVLNHLQGAYCLLFLFVDCIEAARDPYGIRPLCLGQTNQGYYVIASETCAFDAIGAKLFVSR